MFVLDMALLSISLTVSYTISVLQYSGRPQSPYLRVLSVHNTTLREGVLALLATLLKHTMHERLKEKLQPQAR